MPPPVPAEACLSLTAQLLAFSRGAFDSHLRHSRERGWAGTNSHAAGTELIALRYPACGPVSSHHWVAVKLRLERSALKCSQHANTPTCNDRNDSPEKEAVHPSVFLQSAAGSIGGIHAETGQVNNNALFLRRGCCHRHRRRRGGTSHLSDSQGP
eukprot:UN3427